jgi:stage II sporulation protein D
MKPGGSLRFVLATLLVVTAALNFASAQTASTPAADRSTLRVGFWTLWHDRTVTLTPAGTNARMAKCASCDPEQFSAAIKITADQDELVIENAPKPNASHERREKMLAISGAIELSAHGEKETPRVPIEITARKGQLVMSATLPVELYIERVVASESSAADSAESLKALAIVVRSFALHQKHGHPDYDLCDSTHCQLLHWHGNPTRSAAAHAATLETAGETLWFHGSRAAAWFHQNCGGETVRPEEIWPSAAHSSDQSKRFPYLKAVSDPYCTAGGTRTWATVLTHDELTAALARAGLVAPGWKRLAIGRRGDPAKGESPRVQTVRFDSKEISAEDLRLAVGQAFGWGRILSTWFDLTMDGENYHFSGRGSGHGVGLCQAGAAAMSASGKTSAEILAQYFSGAEVRDETTGRAWESQQIGELTVETLSAEDAAKIPEVVAAFNDAKMRAGGVMAGTRTTNLRFTVRAFPSTAAFRNATLAPGFDAAFTEGSWIGTQPLTTLSARKLLRRVLRHEFLHAIVEAQTASSTPLWLREGFVELIGRDGQRESHNDDGSSNALTLDELNHLLKNAQSEAESTRAHDVAADDAAQLLHRYGRAQVETWLRNGLPVSAVKSISTGEKHR